MDHQNIVVTPETTNDLPVLASSTKPEDIADRLGLGDDSRVVIEPGRKSLGFNLIELWRYRELLYFLTWRDIKVRYKQTILGAIWAIMQPLLLMLIFNFVFARLGGIKSDNVPYPIFAFAALLPWTFFANAVTTSGNSLVSNTNLITKVYFPRVIIPAASVAAGLVDFSVAFTLLIIMMVYYDVGLHAGLMLLPVFIVLVVMLALGIGMLMSALNVKYRDVRHALPFLMQVWMFASPVIYPVPTGWRWRWLFALNPMTGIIQGFRSALFEKPFDWFTLGTSAAITLLILIYAVFTFNRMEKSFADVI
jgi:lipopolysaccharide transport system permease protein